MSWPDIQNDLYNKSREYLEDKKGVLKKMVEIHGYKTCHPMDSLDASECAEDCKNFEKEEFAKNCTKNNGLFKCCIRRDKEYCHECRFCCTLPMCTKPPGTKKDTDFDLGHKVEIKDQKKEITANELFFSDEHIYKKPDYYCLKPDSHEDPEKWHRYEAAGFRKAFSKEMLENTKTFKYDKYLNNFEDPKVLAAFTKSDKRARKILKKSYNFHYSKMIPGFKSTSYLPSNENWTNLTKCVKKCIEMENSRFAKKCYKDKGYFKCCVSAWWIGPYEEARNKLIKEGLIKDEPTHICDRKATTDPCFFCSANGMCTKHNPLNGTITNSFYPGMKKRSKGEHRIIQDSKIKKISWGQSL